MNPPQSEFCNNAHQMEKLQTIGNLTGGVAHDFNNILAIISGNLELIGAVATDKDVAPLLDAALAAVDRGARITHQLLAFARKQPLSPKQLDAARLIREIKPMLEMSVGANIDLEIVADSGLWTIAVDPTQLEASLLNLAVNARDAMPEGGRLTIQVGNARIDRDYARAHAEVEPGQYLCVSVSDTGTGMSPDTVVKAFEPFFTTKGVGKGTGLGLSMVFGFAKQSGGHVKIYSEPGVGTIVRLYLPRSAAEALPEELEAARPEMTQKLSGKTVLLIEDEKALLNVYAAQLRSLGCIVESAGNGQEALDLVGKIAVPDLIVTDVILPGNQNGKQIADRLRTDYPRTPVVFMSGFAEDAIIHDGRLDVGSVMLQKPFTLRDLADTLCDALLK